MYPCRGVLHTPHKCPHRGQTDRSIRSDRPMCHFILTPSIPESFISNNFRSLPESFVGRMQYAPTLPNEKCRSQNVFDVLFEAQNRVKMLLRCFLMLKIESKCFCGTFWGSKSSQNVLEILFEAQNRIKILLRWFLSLKIESKCSCGTFWASKSSPNAFEVLFEAQNRVKMILRYFLRLKMEWKCFWGLSFALRWR